MLTGNKGEWSEVYAFVKLMANGVINLCDKNFAPLPGQKLSLQKIFREKVIFGLDNEHHITLTFEDNKTLQVPRAILDKGIETFFNELTIGKGKGAFECISGHALLKHFHQSKLKAGKKKKGIKRDIEIEILDPKVLIPKKVGFSIKSQLGGKPTLLNSSKDNTAFCFEIIGENFDPKVINAIASRFKIMDRVAALRDAGCDFKFSHCKGEVFRQNLIKIDSQMPKILGLATLSSFTGEIGKKKITDVLKSSFFQDKIQDLEIPLDSSSIEYKFKHLLSASALGMVPKTPWRGIIEADGGYIVVKRDGDLVCFHVYNLGDFQDFLLDCTTFDTPSTGKHPMGYVYKKGESHFFDVNCLIKFIEPKQAESQ